MLTISSQYLCSIMLTISYQCSIMLTINYQYLCGITVTIRYLCSIMLTVSYLSLCSIMLAGAACSFSCSSCFLLLKRQNLSSQSEPAVSVSWFRVSVATPRTAPL